LGGSGDRTSPLYNPESKFRMKLGTLKCESFAPGCTCCTSLGFFLGTARGDAEGSERPATGIPRTAVRTNTVLDINCTCTEGTGKAVDMEDNAARASSTSILNVNVKVKLSLCLIN
jgi:hypothetical protein